MKKRNFLTSFSLLNPEKKDDPPELGQDHI